MRWNSGQVSSMLFTDSTSREDRALNSYFSFPWSHVRIMCDFWGLVTHAHHLSYLGSWGRCVRSSPAWATEWVQGQPERLSETMSQNENYRNGRGAGEDGLVLVEDPSSVPNSHVKGPVTLGPRHSVPSSGLCRHLYACAWDTHIHINKNNNKIFFKTWVVS